MRRGGGKKERGEEGEPQPRKEYAGDRSSRKGDEEESCEQTERRLGGEFTEEDTHTKKDGGGVQERKRNEGQVGRAAEMRAGQGRPTRALAPSICGQCQGTAGSRQRGHRCQGDRGLCRQLTTPLPALAAGRDARGSYR